LLKRTLFIFLFFPFAVAIITSFAPKTDINDERFVTYQVNVKTNDLRFYWKNEHTEIFKSIQNLKDWLDKNKKHLVFAMNGGMYKEDNTPLGLYIENSKVLSPLNSANANGNFYLKPNGVFYITADSKPVICTTENFKNNGTIRYATQSGPMLVVNGQIHPAFKKGSENLNVRNGVGIMQDNTVVFVMSKQAINFYDFAEYFKSIGCKNALYLDGFVSRTYLPEKNYIQTDGNFGVIIAVITSSK